MNLKMLRIAIGIIFVLSFIPLNSTSAQVKPGWAQAARLNGVNCHQHDSFGSSVAVSGDTVVVGVPSATVGSNAYQGEAFVYVRPATGWSGLPVPAATLVAAGGAADQHFGDAVAIDGDTIAIGAYGYAPSGKSNQGAVYIFTRTGGVWTQASRLTASDGASLDGLGTTISLSGNTVVAGAFGSGSNKGAAYVFVKPTGGWVGFMNQNAKLLATGGATGDEFGYDVAIDGDTIVVGSNHLSGKAYVFVKAAAGWSGSPAQRATLVNPDTTGQAYFGKVVAVSGDTAAVSDSGASIGSHFFQGAIYIYTKPGAGWSGSPASTAKLYAANGAEGDLLGNSIAISGNLIAAGAPYAQIGAHNSQGAAYVFTRPASGWAGNLSKPIQLAALDGAESDALGVSIAISGTTLVTGAWNATVGTTPNVGTAYVFATKYLQYLPKIKI